MDILDVKGIRIEDYDYELPDCRIARYPVSPRDHSKLLYYKKGEIDKCCFYQLPDLLEEGELLVYNDTKVIQARLHFCKPTGAVIEVFCLEPYIPADYALSFQSTVSCEWMCLIGNARRWKSGSLTQTILCKGKPVNLSATRIADEGSGANGGLGVDSMSHRICFEWDDNSVTWIDILDTLGQLPIPPYLCRETEESDKTTYQTVYSANDGSVAAPTAGLHFTQEVLDSIANKGIKESSVTLHVGAGTFQPVKSLSIGGHPMHREVIEVSSGTIRDLIKYIGHVVAVGTTSVRTLESLYYIGCHILDDFDNPKLQVEQWEPYDAPRNVEVVRALQAILDYLEANGMTSIHAVTRIIIVPSYWFRVVDKLVTNFHQPHSTLLLLVSAFVGGDWRKIYDFALNNDFRFLSYGDSSLLVR